jgi:hypothetical protein
VASKQLKKPDRKSSTSQPNQSGSTDCVLAYMEEFKIPMTREKYLQLAYGDPHRELGPEEEAELPEQFQKADEPVEHLPHLTVQEQREDEEFATRRYSRPRTKTAAKKLNPPKTGAVIDPQDGLFEGMAKLEQELGSKGFLDLLLREIPSKPKAKGK